MLLSATASRSANRMYLPGCEWVKWLHGSGTGEDPFKIRRNKLKSLNHEALIFMKKEFETEDQKVGLLTERKLVMVGLSVHPVSGQRSHCRTAIGGRQCVAIGVARFPFRTVVFTLSTIT